MRRVTSMVFVGGWAGFLGTAAAAACLAIVSAGFPAAAGVPLLGGEVRRIGEHLVSSGNPAVLAAAVAAFVFASAVLLLLLSMWLLQSAEPSDRSAGERLSIATLGFTALIICGLGIAGMDLMAEGASITGIVAVLTLSILAILLDRMIEVDEAEEAREEESYRNALLLARQFGRDAAFRSTLDESSPEARR